MYTFHETYSTRGKGQKEANVVIASNLYVPVCHQTKAQQG